MIRLTLIFAAITSLLACANPGRPIPADFSGQQVVVSNPVSVPAEAGSIRFQNGEVISQRQLSVWDTYCVFRFRELTTQQMEFAEGSSKFERFDFFDERCDKRSCDQVNRYYFQTLSGPEAIDLTCRYRYDFSSWNAMYNPVIFSREQVQRTLGKYLTITDLMQ